MLFSKSHELLNKQSTIVSENTGVLESTAKIVIKVNFVFFMFFFFNSIQFDLDLNETFSECLTFTFI